MRLASGAAFPGDCLGAGGGFGNDQELVTTGRLAQPRQRLGHEPVKGTFELAAIGPYVAKAEGFGTQRHAPGSLALRIGS